MESTRAPQNDIGMIALEERCGSCSGAGSDYDENGLTDCRACSGTGFAPTEFGEKVIALVRRHLQAMPSRKFRE